MVVAKVNFRVSIGKGITVDSFHAPKFTSNILSDHLLSESINLLFTGDDEKRGIVIQKGSRTEFYKSFKYINVIYPVSLEFHSKTRSQAFLFNL